MQDQAARDVPDDHRDAGEAPEREGKGGGRAGENGKDASENEARMPDEKDEGGKGENNKGDGNKGKTDKGEGDKAPPRRSFLRRHPFWVLLGLIVIAALAFAGFVYWVVFIHPYESTDDAFVDSRQFALAPKVSGYVTAVAVEDNQHVKTGEVLFRIDPRDYQSSLDQANAQVAAQKAAIQNADAQIASQISQSDEAKAEITQAEASLQFARTDAQRYRELAQSGAGTVQQAQQATSNLQQQQANYNKTLANLAAVQKQVGSLQAQKATATANLQQAQAQVEQAQLNLGYTTIGAAQGGRVVRLTGAVGQYVEAGQSLAILVPDEIWVTANFKETQITDMRPGQTADLRIDAYPDHAIQGRLDSVQPGSGTAFSLLPAENATGNYVKVVQRVPVKIVVDRWPEDVSIGPGMSVVPTITVRDVDPRFVWVRDWIK